MRAQKITRITAGGWLHPPLLLMIAVITTATIIKVIIQIIKTFLGGGFICTKIISIMAIYI